MWLQVVFNRYLEGRALARGTTHLVDLAIYHFLSQLLGRVYLTGI
jgi:hypothetical protein